MVPATGTMADMRQPITAVMRRHTTADITASLIIPLFAIVAWFARPSPTMAVRDSMVRGFTIAATGIIGKSTNKKGRPTRRPFSWQASVDFMHDGTRAGIDQHHAIVGVNVAILGHRRAPIRRDRREFDVRRHL